MPVKEPNDGWPVNFRLRHPPRISATCDADPLKRNWQLYVDGYRARLRCCAPAALVGGDQRVDTRIASVLHREVDQARNRQHPRRCVESAALMKCLPRPEVQEGLAAEPPRREARHRVR